MASRYDDIIRGMAVDRAAQNVLGASDRDPVAAARARRLSRYLNTPARVIEADPRGYEQIANQRRVQGAIESSPALARWLQDANNAAVARDEVPRLSVVNGILQPWTQAQRSNYVEQITGRGLGPGRPDFANLTGRRPLGLTRPWEATFEERAERIRARAQGEEAADQADAVAWQNEVNQWSPILRYPFRLGQGVNQGWNFLASGLQGVARGVLHDDLGIGSEEWWNAESRNLQRIGSLYDPGAQASWAERSLVGGTASLTALAGALLTRTPLTTLSVASGGEFYGRTRARGAGTAEALQGAVLTGMIEAATEVLPLKFLGAGGSNWLTRFIVSDMIGEQFATFGQDYIDAVTTGGVGESEFWNHRMTAALDTFGATLVMGGGAALLRRTAGVSRLEREAREAEIGVAGQQMLDNLVEQAAESSLRKNDPESFREYVDSIAGESPVRNVHIPIEAIEAYAQTEGADMTFFEPFQDQMQEAAATRGDVVVPIGDAVTYLAGSQAWAQLREDIRVTAGGMTGREARTAQETLFQQIEERGKEIAAEAKAEIESASPFVKLYEDVRNQMIAAGFDPRAAEANAQILAARYERLTSARYGNETLEQTLTNFPMPEFRTAAPGETPAVGALEQGVLHEESREGNEIILTYEAGESRDEVAFIHVNIGEGGRAEISVDPMSRKANRFGAATIRRVASEIRQKYPEITAVFGERESGAKPGRIQEVVLRQTTLGQTQHFGDNQFVVTLFAEANRSTLIHELGHVFLTQEFSAAAQKGASQELKEDVAALKAWFAANGHPVKGGKIPVEAHELFARGMERYVMEGKPPTSGLRRAFANFRAWMLRIYQVVENLRSPITPDVREVMSRMLATQDAIDAERDMATPLFQTAEEAGMTEAEFAAYTESVRAARDEAYDALLFKTMETIRRRENERLRGVRADIEAEVVAEINKRPEFVALHLLRTGRWLGQPDRAPTPTKLNTGWLIDTFGEEVLQRLPRGVLIHRGDGLHGDMVAEMVGAESGHKLVEQLIAFREASEALALTGEQRSVRRKLIDDETERRMSERYGDVLSDGRIEEEAIAAINSASQGEIIAAELRQLAKRNPALERQRTPYQIAREWARRKIAQERIVDVAGRQAIQRYIRAANKAQRAAEAAMLEGNVDEAYRQKQAQLLNHALLAEAKIAADEVDSIVARMQRYAKRSTMQSVDQDYFDRVHELLERFDFKARTQKSLDEKDSFERWAERQAEKGLVVHAPPRIAAIGEHYSRVTLDDLTALNDAVASLMHLGRTKQRMMDAKDARDFAEIRDETLANLEKLPDRKLGDEVSAAKPRVLAGAAAGLLKVETLADEIDAQDPNGPANRIIVQGATNAANRHDDLREQFLEPIAKMFREMPKKLRDRLQDKVTAQNLTWNTVNEGDPRAGTRVTLTRMQWIGVALNRGNVSNLEKMTQGERWALAEVEAETNRILTKEEWDFVDSVWRRFDALWPQVVAVERELTGVAPEPVVANEVMTPFGPYRGGYWPVVYDVTRSKVAEQNEIDAANDLFGYKSGIATPKGHTITRTNARGPMSYRVEEILVNHLERVTTRIAYAAWVRDVLRFVNDPKISGMIDTKLGREYRSQILPWLRRQVNGNIVDKRGAGWWDNKLRSFRVNLSITAMGFAYSTGAAQTLGLSFSAGRIGAKYVGLGLKRSLGIWGGAGSVAGATVGTLLAGPIGAPVGATIGAGLGGTLGGFNRAKEFVFSRSPEMSRRGQELNREVVEVFRKLRGSASVLDHARAMAFWHIAMIDRYIVAMPTWLGAHQKGIDEGMTDAEASAYADKIVRNSQGSGREKDLAAIQSPNSEVMRFFTMFYTPFNVLFNAQWDMARAGKRGDWRTSMQLGFWFLIATTLADAMMSGDWPEDEEQDGPGFDDLAGWFGRNVFFSMFQGVPVARDVAGVVERTWIGKYANLESPVSQNFEAVGKTIDQTLAFRDDGAFPWLQIEDREFDGAYTRGLANGIGLTFGLPTGQVGKTGGFLVDVNSGAAQPEDFRDWYTGLTYGRLPEEGER